MHALSISNLSKTYANGTKAVDQISFDIKQGDFFALLGPNGAGKSTTIGIIASLVNKSSGKVEVFGYDQDQNLNDVKMQIGLVPQEFNFSIFEQVEDILIQQAGYYGINKHEARKRSKEYLQLLDLWDKRHDTARNLSGGMKRRLMIARALIHRPRLLILDEPTAGVDIEIRHSLWEFMKRINNEGTTVILTTHYLEEVEELCKNVAIIDKGRIKINSSLKSLLQKLDRQYFVLELSSALETVAPNDIFNLKKIDSHTLEAELPKSTSLNDLFLYLASQQIVVQSIRSKTNRVESLFLDVTQGG